LSCQGFVKDLSRVDEEAILLNGPDIPAKYLDVHRKAIAMDGKAEPAAGCFSQSFENTLETGESWGLPKDRLYRTAGDMIKAEAARSKDKIDFVVSVTPNDSHFSIAKTALEHGFPVVSVGATGSFVSGDGLFVTNHHVAFGAVQVASTAQHDYLTNGFLARRRGEEIQAKGMSARITESFRDVSKEVLSAVTPNLALADRTKAVEKRMKEIVAHAEKANPGKRGELVGVNFDRTYDATINDYAWSEDYSRSIAVDIRYVLWVT
jgi:hypothetical protein